MTPPRPLAKCGHKAGRPNNDDGPAKDNGASCFPARFMGTFTSYKSMFCWPAAVGASSASPNLTVVTAERYIHGRSAAPGYSIPPPPQPNRSANNKKQIEARPRPCPHSGSDLICSKTHFSGSLSLCGRAAC